MPAHPALSAPDAAAATPPAAARPGAALDPATLPALHHLAPAPWAERPFRGTKVVCLARTFGRHALELGNPVPTEPLYFLKAPSAIIGDGAPIVVPALSRVVHHEGEAVVEVGRRLRPGVTAAEAEAAIAAWTVLNDVTARDLQQADGGRFTRAKGFDGFCPVSPTRAPHLHWPTARIQCWVNGALRQDGPLSDLLFSPGEILAAVASVMTLEPGDLVSLGTPEGVGALVAGDVVSVRLLDGAGAVVAEVRNPVVAPG